MTTPGDTIGNVYEFGPFRVDAEHERVLRDGEPQAITHKAFEVLLVLVCRSHEVVGKNELMQTVWPDRVVEESNLSQCIFLLRKLLGDTHGTHRYIVTVPGRGYRFAEQVLTVTCGKAEVATLPYPLDADVASARLLPGLNQPRAAHWRLMVAIGVLAVATMLLVSGYVIRRNASHAVNVISNARATPAELAILARVPQKSVAVLPFVSEGGDSRQRYLADGLSAELISALTQLDGLKVIAQHSSFAFRDSNASAARIGAALGVANLIEGSVRQAAGRTRIVVNLVRARDGSSAWSHTYDPPAQDVLKVQAAIGKAVAAALNVKLLGGTPADGEQPPGGNVEAYQLMLQARAIDRSSINADQYRMSIALSKKAVQLDPGYAYAWGILSRTLINLGIGDLSGSAQQHALAEARLAANRQLILAPGAVATRAVQGFVMEYLDDDKVGALTQYQLALAAAPHDSSVMFSLALQYGTFGHVREGIKLLRQAIAIDPLRPDWYLTLGGYLANAGQLDQAAQAIHTTLALQPDYPSSYYQLVLIDALRGDGAAALHDANQETSPKFKAIAVALAKQISGQKQTADAALADYIARHGTQSPFDVADLYALRGEPDNMFAWLDRTRRSVSQSRITANNLYLDPLVMRYRHDPRFRKLSEEFGLPAPDAPLPRVGTDTATSASRDPMGVTH